jgi:sialic acid synthase
MYNQVMRQLTIGDYKIQDDSPAYVIAEIGHNHQGNLELAFEMIIAASQAGASAVKFQKRDNKKLYTPKAYNAEYNSENAFGKTYGEHRDFLEFSVEDYNKCIKLAKNLNVTFFATPFDFNSADFLNDLGSPIFKIASGDLQNIPLLEYISKFQKPMIISTGGANFEMIERAVTAIRKNHNNFAILQCTASYPAKFEQLNLRVISKLREIYSENIIGYSGHDNGIAMSTVAYTLGARIIEKHFTLNRTLKGTDHAFSLEPQGMQKLVRDLDRTRVALGDGDKQIYESELLPIKKMGKMIVSTRKIEVGHILTFADLEFRSPADGLPPYMYTEIIGKKVVNQIEMYEPINFNHLQ